MYIGFPLNSKPLSIHCVMHVTGACLCMVFSDHVCFIGTVYSNDAGSLRWVLPYQDPCVCTAIRPGGHLPYKPATGHYLEGLFLSEDSDEIRKFFGCPGKTLSSIVFIIWFENTPY